MDAIKRRLTSISQPMTSKELSDAVYKLLTKLYPSCRVDKGAVNFTVYNNRDEVDLTVKIKRAVVAYEKMVRLYLIEDVEINYCEPIERSHYIVEIIRDADGHDAEKVVIKDNLSVLDIISRYEGIKDAKVVISKVTTKRVYMKGSAK